MPLNSCAKLISVQFCICDWERVKAYEKNEFSIKSSIFNHTRETLSATSLYNCKCDIVRWSKKFPCQRRDWCWARGFNHLLMCVGTGKAGSGEGIKMIVWQNCLIASKLCTWLSGEEKADYTCWCWPTAHRRACACVAMHGNCPFYFVLSSRWWEFFVRVTTASAAAAATDSSNKLTIIRQQQPVRWASGGGIPSHTPQNTCYFHSQSCTENQNARSRCARGRAAAAISSQGLAGGGSCNRSASNLMLPFKTISYSGVCVLFVGSHAPSQNFQSYRLVLSHDTLTLIFIMLKFLIFKSTPRKNIYI